NMDRLFPVRMLAGMPTYRNLRLQYTTAHGREAQLVSHHQFDAGVLTRPDPGNSAIVSNHGRALEPFLNSITSRKPLVIEVHHHRSFPRHAPGPCGPSAP